MIVFSVPSLTPLDQVEEMIESEEAEIESSGSKQPMKAG